MYNKEILYKEIIYMGIIYIKYYSGTGKGRKIKGNGEGSRN